MTLNFQKMNGAGNDFVVIDNRKLKTHLSREQIAYLCNRQHGIGADGLLAVEPSDNGANYKFRYYNADGGEAEMCGNGARCFGKFTAALSGEGTEKVTFETIAGTLSAQLVGEHVCVAMSDPFDLTINAEITIDGLELPIHAINTGVPHAVVFVPELDDFDIIKYGEALRNHAYFQPSGTNVNFVKVTDAQNIAIRTYERGVEDETLACGTGMAACAIIHHLLNAGISPVNVVVKGGETLKIGFDSKDRTFTNVTLTGSADFTFHGQIDLPSL